MQNANKLKVIELFGGIGAPRKALSRLGIDFEVVDYVEIDQNAVNSYNHIYNENFVPQDITKWDKTLDCDLIFHGSPCQDFSTAGLNGGGLENSGTRSSLMFETIRIVKQCNPSYVIWENVKNVLSKRHIETFKKYLDYMESLGYKNYYKILNSLNYGIPQNRERLYCVSVKNSNIYDFPKPIELNKKLIDFIEKEVDQKFYLSNEQLNRILYSNFMQEKRRIQEKDYTDTLLARDWKDPKCICVVNATKKGYLEANQFDSINLSYPESKTRRARVGKEISQTLLCNDAMGIYDEKGVRKMTPLEYWLLMGFDKEDFEKVKNVNSKTQLYKQAGNSIVVNVLEHLFKNLLVDYI